MNVVEIARVTADELLRNPAEVLDQVAAGKKVEVIRDGVLIAAMRPPDITEAMIAGLIKAGILEPDWQERQQRTLQRLRAERAGLKQWVLANPPLPAQPHKQPLSQVLIQMREEETR